MRVISLWQPWAELIARGLKQYETRSWPCEKLGEVAIHAAKRKFRDADMTREARTQMLMDEVDPFDLAYGAVICVCNIAACVETEEGAGLISRREFLYGDWSEGRFAWRLENVKRLPKPIPLAGRQGFFYWPGGRSICAEALR